MRVSEFIQAAANGSDLHLENGKGVSVISPITRRRSDLGSRFAGTSIGKALDLYEANQHIEAYRALRDVSPVDLPTAILKVLCLLRVVGSDDEATRSMRIRWLNEALRETESLASQDTTHTLVDQISKVRAIIADLR